MSATKTATLDDDRAIGGEPPIPAVATAPEAQGAAAEEGRQYGALIASAIIETFGVDLPENQADQAAIIQAVLANYVEILCACDIRPALILIAVKNAGEVCSARFLSLAEFFRGAASIVPCSQAHFRGI